MYPGERPHRAVELPPPNLGPGHPACALRTHRRRQDGREADDAACVQVDDQQGLVEQLAYPARARVGLAQRGQGLLDDLLQAGDARRAAARFQCLVEEAALRVQAGCLHQDPGFAGQFEAPGQGGGEGLGRQVAGYLVVLILRDNSPARQLFQEGVLGRWHGVLPGLAARRGLARRQGLEDGLHVVDAAAPRPAGDGLERRP